MDLLRTKLWMTALISRLAVIGLSIVTNAIIPDHDAGVFAWTKSPAHNITTFSDQTVSFLLDGLTKWDGQYFLHIANSGYSYENTLAFFPLYPLCVRIAAEVVYWCQVDYGLIHFSNAIKIGGVIVNVAFFTLAVLALFELSRYAFLYY